MAPQCRSQAAAVLLLAVVLARCGGLRLPSDLRGPSAAAGAPDALNCTFLVEGAGGAENASLSVAVTCDGATLFDRTVNATGVAETTLTPSLTLFKAVGGGTAVLHLHGGVGGLVFDSTFASIPPMTG
ncbi:unnamed protein product, partial [Ostreobium quekettii]